MKVKIFLALVVVSTVALSNAFAQQVAKMTPGGIGFLEYLPQDYKSNSNSYPIVISLHGIKEKGNTLSEVSKVANVGLPKYVKYGQQYPFILISPQLKTTMGRWTGDYIMQVLNYVKTYLRINNARVYLTGLSLGGGGVWSVATAYPHVWAAIVPICSGYNLTGLACNIAGSNIPTWGFHGDSDTVVGEGVTINMINAINNCSPKPSPLAKYTIFAGLNHVIWDKVYKETTALNWMLSFQNGSSTPTSPTNNPPLANAGSDKSLTLPSNATTIYGSGSDPDGNPLTFGWSKKSGGSVSMSGTTTKDLKLSNLIEGSYVFTLTVKDDKGASDIDDVSVIVKDGTVTTNVLPVANAGSNKLVVLPQTAIALIGSAYDKDGSIVSYNWSKLSGPSVSLSGITSSTLKLASLVGGTYIFRMTVKDNKGAIDTDDVTVNVTKAPVVNAGSDRTVTLPLASLTLTATASDPDGTIASYQWSKSSGPTIKMTNSSTKSVTLSGLYSGTYVIKIAVKDNKGAAGYDYVKIVVNGSTASIQWLDQKAGLLAMNSGSHRVMEASIEI
jgi:hypothetical protein